MTRHLRLARVGFVFPEFLSRVQIEAVDQPMVNSLRRIAHAFAQV